MSNNRPQDVADILEALDEPTPNEVYVATREYDTNYIAAAAASKAHAAGGGGSGSQPELLGPFTVAFDDADVIEPENGVGAPVGPELEAGTILLGVFGYSTVTWAASLGFDELDVNIADPDTSNGGTIATIRQTAPPPTFVPSRLASDAATIPWLIRSATQLFFAVWPTDSGDVTAGVAVIYLLMIPPVT